MKYTADSIKRLAYSIKLNKVIKNGKYVVKNKRVANQLMDDLKKEFDAFYVEEDEKKFNQVFENLFNSPITNSYIKSGFFPNSMEKYGKYIGLGTFSSDFRFELRWLIYCIMYCKNDINAILAKREKYDNFVLLNKYNEALDEIELIEKEYGVSIWSVECKFFLYAKLGKTGRELLNFDNNRFYKSVLNFYELKNRDNVTSDEYFYIVEKEINSVKSNLNPDNSIIEYYNYKLLSVMYNADPEKIMDVFKIVRYGAIFDRYLFFIDICNWLVNQEKNNFLYKTLSKYIMLLEDIKDDTLTSYRFIFDSLEGRKEKYILKSRLEKAKEDFIIGNLESARYKAIELLKLFPNNTEAMSLYVETNILINDGQEFFSETNLGDLLKELSSVYRLSNDRDEAMEKVIKLSICCGQSTWSESIINNVLNRCQEYGKSEFKRTLILSNVQHLDIETLIACLSKEECIKYINDNLNLKDKYISFRKAFLEENFQVATNICKVNLINDLLYLHDLEKTTEEKMKFLHSIDGPDASIAIRGVTYFLSAIDLEIHMDICLKIATDLVVDNILTALFIPLEKIVKYIDNGPDEIRQNICTPIVYYVYAYYFNKSKIDDLGIICEDFFLFQGIEQPSRMDISNYNLKCIIYFLKNVCSTKILDVACLVSNQQERDKERVEILNVLSKIDAQNAKQYEHEIRDITQKLMINAELKIIEENRIHVNVDGMRDTLEEKYKNDFLRYILYREKRVQQLTIPDDKDTGINTIKNVPERILRELIYHIRDAFVSSDEYGLNGYLSLNIRHGTLEDELRSPLYKAKLTTKKDVTTNLYKINSLWTSYINDSDKQVLTNSIINFYNKTENIIAKLKKEYIQISTEEKETKGLFDYHLDEMDMLVLSIKADSINTFDEFVDLIFSHLWNITERNLTNIKKNYKNRNFARLYTCI
jgi:hypothetical protein